MEVKCVVTALLLVLARFPHVRPLQGRRTFLDVIGACVPASCEDVSHTNTTVAIAKMHCACRIT